jgi:hypothetical protein
MKMPPLRSIAINQTSLSTFAYTQVAIWREAPLVSTTTLAETAALVYNQQKTIVFTRTHTTLGTLLCTMEGSGIRQIPQHVERVLLSSCGRGERAFLVLNAALHLGQPGCSVKAVVGRWLGVSSFNPIFLIATTGFFFVGKGMLVQYGQDHGLS